jgi:ABC-type multidrug transport system fused ATPase/permease subunit
MANLSRSSTPLPPEPEELGMWEKFIVTRYIIDFVRSCRVWYGRKHKLPIIVFYRYMWENNKPLFLRTLFFNYVFQFILEILPWWASRRKVGNKLRTSRIKLNHNMVTGRDFQWKLMRDFVVKTVLFAILDSLNRYLKNRLSLENKFEIRRLVLERILYSEIDELDKITKSYSGSLEDKVARDITSTLNFINKYLPSLVSGIYAFVVEGSELFKKRKSINTLAFAYPIAITSIQRVIDWAQYRWFKKAQKKVSKDNTEKLDMSMTHALSGIIDIQTNNLQTQQLAAFDIVTQDEVRNKEGFANYFFQSLSALNKMSAFSYVIEIWCVHRIMKTGNLDHKQFSKIQQEIDHVWTIGRRALNLLRRTKHVFKAQSKVVKLLDITTFVDEASKFKPLDPYEPFHSLVIDNVKFTYSGADPTRQDLVLDLNTRLIFEPNKKYAILGQNRAGKSTLTKLISKLYAPNAGELYWNGIPYSQLPRMALRDMISYIPQTPLIIGGTIRENILMGNPHATEAQLLFAAEASGILDFLGVGGVGSGAHHHHQSGSISTVGRVGSLSLLSKSTDKIGKLKKKKKKKSKKKKKKKSSDDEDDDDIGGMSRTLSFAELGEIVQPRGAFFESGFGKNKYPSNFDDGSGNGDDDSGGSSGSDGDDDDWSDSSSSSSSEEDLFTPRTPRAPAIVQPIAMTASAPSHASSDDGASESSGGSSNDDSHHFSSSTSRLPTSASTPNFDFFSSGRASPHSTGSGGGGNPSIGRSGSLPKSSSSGNLARMSRKARERKAEQLKVLDELLAAGGADVSGGFAQSIALARVFVRTSAKMVILDESTSHMDPVKLRTVVFPKLLDFVEEWGMCLIVITHHYNSIRDFDHLIVMQEGKVVHEGTHDELCDQQAEWYLQLNPVSNTMLSYHSTRDLSCLAEFDDEDFPSDEDLVVPHC